MMESLEEWRLRQLNKDISTSISRMRKHEVEMFCNEWGVKPAFVYRQLIEQGSLDNVVDKIMLDREERHRKTMQLLDGLD